MTIMISVAAAPARCMVQRTSSYSAGEGLPSQSWALGQQSAGRDWLLHRGKSNAWRPGLPGHRHHACADLAPRISEASMPATRPTAWTCLGEAATIAFSGLSHMLLRTQQRGGPGGPKLSCGSLLRVKVHLLPLPLERFLCYWLESGEPFHLLVIASSSKSPELIFTHHSWHQKLC